jgi:uncharacterized protein (UPF0261 family)
MKYIFLLGSLDTKGAEIEFLRARVLAEGGHPLVIDTGVLGRPTIACDIDRETVARAGGSSLEELALGGDKARALVVMADGASRLLQDYLKRSEIGGILSAGGSRGTALGTRVMQSLPVGVPKLMVSTMASGLNPFGPYVGTKDITLMYSVADVQGVNAVTRPIFTNAAAAIAGMSRAGAALEKSGRTVLAASMLGVTTDLVGQIQGLMEPEGCEVIAFHANGPGGQAMEEMIAGGLVEGVFDVTPGELTQWVAGSPYSAGPERMQAAGRKGIPQVAAPGGVDFIIEGPRETLPSKYAGRKWMVHTPTITLVRTAPDEMAAVAKLVAERLSRAARPGSSFLQAFGWFSVRPTVDDPEADQVFRQEFKAHVHPRWRWWWIHT